MTRQVTASGQLALFDLPASGGVPSRTARRNLDRDSETLLDLYTRRRLAAGAKFRTVVKEVSQLRSLARLTNNPPALRDLFKDPGAVARALIEPNAPITLSTGRCRLIAAQRLVGVCGAELGVNDAEGFVAALDQSLPSRSHREWHSAGTIVAGTRARRRPHSPTLQPIDLERIVARAGNSDDYRGCRDRALIALHCYSGLRPHEIASLRRSQVVVDGQEDVVEVEVQRDQRLLRLLLPTPAAGPLLALCCLDPTRQAGSSHYLFRRSERHTRPLTVRAVAEITHRACAGAGFRLATAADLRAAFAYWLRLHGLSDHEAAAVLGLKQVRSLDRLLERHVALDAQRRVRELLA